MQIKEESKFKLFFKRYGAITLTAVLVVGCVLMIALTASIGTGPKEEEGVETGNNSIIFTSPLKDAQIVKDYSEALVYNEALERYESHLGVDLISNTSSDVCAVLDGKITDVSYNTLQGYYVEITHEGGFVSEYSSLDKDVFVKIGDSIKKGQIIGKTGDTGTGEKNTGAQLHFALYQNGRDVDPNNYLDLQNK